MKKVQFSFTIFGADLQRKLDQVDKFLSEGHQVLMTVEVGKGQGRLFELTGDRVVQLAGLLKNARKVSTPYRKGAGFGVLVS